MAQYRCTQCGSIVEAEEGVKVGKCPSCGALFVFPNDFPQKAALYRRAADMRDAGNFAAAQVNYGRILKIDATETEAHWGYLLSRYGVEVVKSGENYGQILFHRLETASFTQDPSYGKMLEYCPQEARYYYQGMSRRIEEMHGKMLEIARRQGDFDIYLACTQGPGAAAYQLANQVGAALDGAGYRVFLPCTMLEGVPEGEKNLYEMAAAQKSSAMLVVSAPGVDFSESRLSAAWKRYWELSQEDPGRKLLSVYRDTDPGRDLPMELSALQAINCGVPAFQDLVVQQINGLFGRGGRSAELNRRILDLKRQADGALAEKDFDKALGLYQEISALDREEPAAYWGAVQAMTGGLRTPWFSGDLDTAYQRALQFAGDRQKDTYRQSMRELMAEPVWQQMCQGTRDFTDYQWLLTKDFDTCEGRVRLYVPRGDPRLERLEAYKSRAGREWAVEAQHEKYKRRDVGAQPLFAAQRQAENRILTNRTARKQSGGKLRWRLVLAAAFFLLAQVMYVLALAQSSKDYLIGFTGPVLLMAGLTFELRGLSGMRYWFCAPISVVAVLLLSKLGGIVFLVAAGASLLVLLVIHILQLIFSLGGGRNRSVLKKAIQELKEADAHILEAYRQDMETINREKGTPGAPYPDYTPAHSEGVILELPAEKQSAARRSLVSLIAAAALAAGIVVGVNVLSNVLYAGGWHDVESVVSYYYTALGLRADGTVACAGYNGWKGLSEVGKWTDITQVAIGVRFNAGLRADGTVVVSARKDDPAKQAEQWTDIVSISAMNHCLVGLKSDGTCVAVGDNEHGECDIGGWTNMETLHEAGTGDTTMTIGLRADGTVACTNSEYQQYIDVTCKELAPIAAVYGDWTSFVLLTEDGQLHGAGNNAWKQLPALANPEGRSVVDVSARNLVAVLWSDGTVQGWGELGFDMRQLEGWSDITAISGGNENLLGLRADGACEAFGKNDHGQCDVDDWTDMKSLTAGYYASYGVRKDGSVAAAGVERFGMSYVEAKGPIELVQFWIDSLGWKE